MHDQETIVMRKQVLRKGRNKFWFFIISMFLLWFMLLFFFNSGSKLEKKEGSLLRDNFVDNHESNFVPLDRNSNEGMMKETGFVMDKSDRDDPIENFFVGGDWDRYLDEISKAGKEQQPDDQIHHMENGARSINNEYGKANQEDQSGNVRAARKNRADIDDQMREQANSDSDSESCSGRYIYIHDLPSQFNEDLLEHCRSLNEWSNICPYLSNFGFGPRLRNSERVLSSTGWYHTNQFMLEVILHNKMKKYKCLTNDSSVASAIFVPYHAGLDVARYLWNSNKKMKDYYSRSLVKWLSERPEWKRLWGRDHFMVAGRITWDFRRLTKSNSDWGNQLMILPESRNMTILTIESSPWNNNDFAIPYPTYFHPSSDSQVFHWQNRMRRTKRRFLFTFAGGPRPNRPETIRSEIINQCQAARRKCRLLECVIGSHKCYEPVNLMKMFQSSTFCLQPPGDSYTRRSTFDSILAGCIPVFFHPGSAYSQYLWHLPKDYTKYSVFIPADKIKDDRASIENTLSRIPRQKVRALREQVIKMIPGMVYADPSSGLETLEDAFDLTIDGVLERVEKIKMDIKNGKNFSADIEEFTWKKNLFGREEEHEWDPFFDRSKMIMYY